MKKNDVKIKTITLADQINVIERVVSSYFLDGKYTPYYAEMALICGIVENFIDGIEIEEDDDLYELSRTDEDINAIVNKFLIPAEKAEDSKEPDYYGMTAFIMNCVNDKVEFLKQNAIHNTGDMQKITEFCDVIIDSFSNFANLITNKFTPEQMSTASKVMEKLADSNMTKEDIVEIIKDAAGFDMDKAAEEIIDAKNKEIVEKNKEIVELKKYKALNEAKNVLADK